MDNKIFKSTPTCFESQRIHHQRAKYCTGLSDDESSVIRNMLGYF